MKMWMQLTIHLLTYDMCTSATWVRNDSTSLPSKNSLPMKCTPLNICTRCFVRKQHRVSFHSKGPHRRPNIIDLVHIDVCSVDCKYLGILLVITLEKLGFLFWKLKMRYLMSSTTFMLVLKEKNEVKMCRADNGGDALA